MDSKQLILEKIRKHTADKVERPQNALSPISYQDPIFRFQEIIAGVGGTAIELQSGEDINEIIAQHYPEARNIASYLPYISCKEWDMEAISSPQDLNGIDVAVIEGAFGVCENGCIWVEENVPHRALFFIAEYLVILLNKKNLVHNMHEAYKEVENRKSSAPYSCFISGPSKTADIEQSLVIGAHGAKGTLVILY